MTAGILISAKTTLNADRREKMDRISMRELSNWPDPNTDPRLLPPHLRASGHDVRMLCHQVALIKAIECILDDSQREIVRMRYWMGMSLGEISRITGVSASAVCKRLNGILDTLKGSVEYFTNAYIAVKRAEAFLADS